MKPERRTWQFWVWGFVFLFLAHALAVLRFGEKQLPSPVREQPRPFFYLVVDEASERRVSELTLGRDPTLFAIPNMHGFSGGAWQRFRAESLNLTNRPAAPEPLMLSAVDLARTVNDYLATNRPSDEQLLATLRTAPPPEFPIHVEALVSNSIARVEGSLATRALVSAPRLPSVSHSDLLQRTIVSVVVNGDGIVESASVWRSSGSRQADDAALALSREFLFDPIRGDAAARAVTHTSGRLVFTWHVVTSTNATATAALP